MRVESAKKVYFKDQVRRSLLFRGLIPLLIMMTLLMTLGIVIIQFRIILNDRSEMEKLTAEMESTLDAYFDGFEQLTLSDGAESNEELEMQVSKLVADKSLRARIFVIDQEGNSILRKDEVPNFLRFKSDLGILSALKTKPEDRALLIKHYRVNERNQSELQFGIQRQGKFVVGVIEDRSFALYAREYDVPFILADSYYRILYQSHPWKWDALGRVPNELHDLKMGKSILLENGSFVNAKELTLQNGEIRALSITNMTDLVQITVVFAVALLIIVLLSLLFTVYQSKRLAEQITKNLNVIVEAFQEVEHGNLNHELSIYTNEEFAIISRAYGDLTESIQELLHSNTKKQEEMRIAQIKQLESQFHPHFLFNTLENIRYLVALDPQAATKMIIDLSAILRASIVDAFSEVPMKENVDYLDRYMNIMKMRFGDRLTYTLKMDPALADCMVPKLIFQPIVENSIKYGFEPNDSLHIDIDIFSRDGTIYCQIRDDGEGLSETQLEQIRTNLLEPHNEQRHSGLYNVHRRLYLMFGAGFGLDIESKEGKGLCVTLRMPEGVQDVAHDNRRE